MTSVGRRVAALRMTRPVLLLGLSVLASGLPIAGTVDAPKRLFDPRRPPERELELSVDDGFTLAAVGDCIISRPLSPMLARDAGFAAVVKILRDADATFGNFENSALDIRAFKGYPQSWIGDWVLMAPPEVARDLKTL